MAGELQDLAARYAHRLGHEQWPHVWSLLTESERRSEDAVRAGVDRVVGGTQSFDGAIRGAIAASNEPSPRPKRGGPPDDWIRAAAGRTTRKDGD